MQCGTCHVIVPEDWILDLPEIKDLEDDKLSTMFNAGTLSRLSCQLTVDEIMQDKIINLP